jgi:hypothetical protein
VTFPRITTAEAVTPDLVSAGDPVEWADLSPRQQQFIQSLRDTDLLTPVTGEAGAPQALRCSIP